MYRYKFQDGMMPQGGMMPQDNGMQPMDAAMMQQMMAQSGYEGQQMPMEALGNGVDINGQPTPNTSGEPSFADIQQEIERRYDKLIIPLEKKLEQLKKKLEENPSDTTIKNEIKRIEQKIDALEQQEDMEMQQLEADVESVGNQIEQQKQMEGYGEQQQMPQEEMQGEPMYQEQGQNQIDPAMLQQMMAAQQGQQEGMSMMQRGGIVKHQSTPETPIVNDDYEEEYEGYPDTTYIPNDKKEKFKKWINDNVLTPIKNYSKDRPLLTEMFNTGAYLANLYNPAQMTNINAIANMKVNSDSYQKMLSDVLNERNTALRKAELANEIQKTKDSRMPIAPELGSIQQNMNYKLALENAKQKLNESNTEDYLKMITGIESVYGNPINSARTLAAKEEQDNMMFNRETDANAIQQINNMIANRSNSIAGLLNSNMKAVGNYYDKRYIEKELYDSLLQAGLTEDTIKTILARLGLSKGQTENEQKPIDINQIN